MFPSEQDKTDVIKFYSNPQAFPATLCAVPVHFLSCWKHFKQSHVMSFKPHGKQDLTYLLFMRILHFSWTFRRRGEAVLIDTFTSSHLSEGL